MKYAIGILLAVTLVLTYMAHAEECVDAKICYLDGKPPVTVMHGTPLWGDIPIQEGVSEVPLAPLQAPKKIELVSTANLDAPHKALTGSDLTVWNQVCRDQDPAAVYEWRYKRCNALDSEFSK